MTNPTKSLFTQVGGARVGANDVCKFCVWLASASQRPIGPGSSGGAFGGDQVIASDERHQETIEVHLYTSRPCLDKGHTRNTHQNIHAHGRHPHLIEVPLLCEIGCRQVCQRRAELLQRTIDGFGVSGVGADPKIQVFGVIRRIESGHNRR